MAPQMAMKNKLGRPPRNPEANILKVQLKALKDQLSMFKTQLKNQEKKSSVNSPMTPTTSTFQQQRTPKTSKRRLIDENQNIIEPVPIKKMRISRWDRPNLLEGAASKFNGVPIKAIYGSSTRLNLDAQKVDETAVLDIPRSTHVAPAKEMSPTIKDKEQALENENPKQKEIEVLNKKFVEYFKKARQAATNEVKDKILYVTNKDHPSKIFGPPNPKIIGVKDSQPNLDGESDIEVIDVDDEEGVSKEKSERRIKDPLFNDETTAQHANEISMDALGAVDGVKSNEVAKSQEVVKKANIQNKEQESMDTEVQSAEASRPEGYEKTYDPNTPTTIQIIDFNTPISNFRATNTAAVKTPSKEIVNPQNRQIKIKDSEIEKINEVENEEIVIFEDCQPTQRKVVRMSDGELKVLIPLKPLVNEETKSMKLNTPSAPYNGQMKNIVVPVDGALGSSFKKSKSNDAPTLTHENTQKLQGGGFSDLPKKITQGKELNDKRWTKKKRSASFSGRSQETSQRPGGSITNLKMQSTAESNYGHNNELSPAGSSVISKTEKFNNPKDSTTSPSEPDEVLYFITKLCNNSSYAKRVEGVLRDYIHLCFDEI